MTIFNALAKTRAIMGRTRQITVRVRETRSYTLIHDCATGSVNVWTHTPYAEKQHVERVDPRLFDDPRMAVYEHMDKWMPSFASDAVTP